MVKVPGKRSWRAALIVGVGISSCGRDCDRVSAAVQHVQRILEICAVACSSLLLLVLVGGGVGTLVKNLRAPTSRSRGWGRALGALNVAFAVLGLVVVLTSPPREPATRANAPDVTNVDMVDSAGRLVAQPSPPPDRVSQRPGGEGAVEWGAALVLLALSMTWLGFGLAVFAIAQRARPLAAG